MTRVGYAARNRVRTQKLGVIVEACQRTPGLRTIVEQDCSKGFPYCRQKNCL